jgi:hypothetical protein
LIFVRTHGIASDLISLGELLKYGDNNWTHVGVVINKKLLPELHTVSSCNNNSSDENQLFLWESSWSGTLPFGIKGSADMSVLDVESKQGVYGVQIRDLKEVIKAHLSTDSRNRVAWCALLQHPLDYKQNETQTEYETRIQGLSDTICKVHRDYFHRHYEMNPLNMLAVLYSPFRFIRDYITGPSQTVFCSKFVTILFEELGMISKQVNPSNVSPTELSNASISQEKGMVQLCKAPVYIFSMELECDKCK